MSFAYRSSHSQPCTHNLTLLHPAPNPPYTGGKSHRCSRTRPCTVDSATLLQIDQARNLGYTCCSCPCHRSGAGQMYSPCRSLGGYLAHGQGRIPHTGSAFRRHTLQVSPHTPHSTFGCCLVQCLARKRGRCCSCLLDLGCKTRTLPRGGRGQSHHHSANTHQIRAGHMYLGDTPGIEK